MCQVRMCSAAILLRLRGQVIGSAYCVAIFLVPAFLSVKSLLILTFCFLRPCCLVSTSQLCVCCNASPPSHSFPHLPLFRITQVKNSMRYASFNPVVILILFRSKCFYLIGICISCTCQIAAYVSLNLYIYILEHLTNIGTLN